MAKKERFPSRKEIPCGSLSLSLSRALPTVNVCGSWLSEVHNTRTLYNGKRRVVLVEHCTTTRTQSILRGGYTRREKESVCQGREHRFGRERDIKGVSWLAYIFETRNGCLRVWSTCNAPKVCVCVSVCLLEQRFESITARARAHTHLGNLLSSSISE